MMKKCYVCNGVGGFEHLGRDICRKCFLQNMEKRVRKQLARKRFGRNSKVLVVGELEKVLLERAVKGLPLKIFFRRRLPKKVKRFDYVVIGKSMDGAGEEFLEGLFQGRLVLGKKGKKFFNILEPLTEAEAEQYAKLKKIDFKTREGKTKEKRLLENLREFPELRYNLYKNIKELREKF